MTLIVDLSNVNAITATAFPVMKAAGVTAAWLKLTEGRTFDDRYYRVREQLAERTGLRVGAYHYARPDANTPKEEALHFLASYDGHDDRRALKVALDMEAPQAAHLGRSLIAWSREWNQHVRHELGHWPVFYSYPAYVSYAMGVTRADRPIGGGLWLAAYARNDGKEHPHTVPPPWKRAVAHQFTSNGRLPGVVGPVDLSHAARLAPLLAHQISGRL